MTDSRHAEAPAAIERSSRPDGVVFMSDCQTLSDSDHMAVAGNEWIVTGFDWVLLCT